MVLVVVGNAVATVFRCQTLAAPIRRAMAGVAVIVMMCVVAIVAPVVMPVIAMIITAVRAMRVVTLRIAVTIVVVIVVLLRRRECCASGQQRQSHQRSNEAFHQRTSASQERPVQFHRRSFKLDT